MLDVVRALEHIDIGSRQDFYHALRCLLVHRPEDLAMFDDVFRVFWRQRSGERAPQRLGALGEEIRFGPPEVELPSLAAGDDADTTQTEELAALTEVEIRTFSSREVLRETDFAQLTADELAEAELLMAQLRWGPGRATHPTLARW